MAEDIDSISESYVLRDCRKSAAEIIEGDGILVVMFRIDHAIWVLIRRVDVRWRIAANLLNLLMNIQSRLPRYGI